LLIEDNPTDVLLFKESLDSLSNSKMITISRLAELDTVSGTKPELVFLDLNLPDSRGIETFTKVNNRFPDAAIIIVSGLEDERMAVQALQAGAQDYMVKGEFDTKSIAKLVRYAIERKRSQIKLGVLEETHRLIINSALDAIVGMDVEGRITIWTPRAETIFGWKEEEVLGKIVADIIVPEELREAHLKGLRRYLDTGTPVILNKLIEITAIDRNGRRFPIELTVTPIRTGESIFFCSFIRDITERYEAQQQIVRARKHSDDIIQSLPGLFYLFTREGKYIRWNKRKELISGYSHEEIAAMNPLQFFKEDQEIVKKHIEDCFRYGETVVEADLVTKDGRKIPFYFTGLRVEYEGVECLLGTGIDISDRKEAEDLLRKTSERLRELSAHLQTVREEERIRISREIHDELGQQLTVLKMDISWLKKKVDASDPKVQQKMDDLMKVIDHTVKTVRKISSDLRPSLLDDLGLVAALEWHSQEFEKRAGVRIKFNAAVNELEINSEISTAMFRIFQETMTNVARHSDATEVETSILIENGKLVMRVRDNGKGFSRNDITDKRTLGILGMQERAAIIEGEYNISSKPGEGTIVEVKVPIGGHQIEKSLL
jgi:two-component system sensor histidine kinase UhpB